MLERWVATQGWCSFYHSFRTPGELGLGIKDLAFAAGNTGRKFTKWKGRTDVKEEFWSRVAESEEKSMMGSTWKYAIYQRILLGDVDIFPRY